MRSRRSRRGWRRTRRRVLEPSLLWTSTHPNVRLAAVRVRPVPDTSPTIIDTMSTTAAAVVARRRAIGRSRRSSTPCGSCSVGNHWRRSPSRISPPARDLAIRARLLLRLPRRGHRRPFRSRRRRHPQRDERLLHDVGRCDDRRSARGRRRLSRALAHARIRAASDGDALGIRPRPPSLLGRPFAGAPRGGGTGDRTRERAAGRALPGPPAAADLARVLFAMLWRTGYEIGGLETEQETRKRVDAATAVIARTLFGSF